MGEGELNLVPVFASWCLFLISAEGSEIASPIYNIIKVTNSQFKPTSLASTTLRNSCHHVKLLQRVQVRVIGEEASRVFMT
jgi:hypothetical protein